MKILNEIQQRIKVPKQPNKNVAYKSRSAEDIVEMVKPLLKDTTITLLLSDEIVNIGDRYYVKATATLSWEEGAKNEVKSISATAYAREADTSPMMSPAQITGSTSSYARKYALNGLFAIDDTQDDDTRAYEQSKPIASVVKTVKVEGKPYDGALASINKTTTLGELEAVVKKIESSKLLTKKEKEELTTASIFKSEELSTNDQPPY